MTYPVREDTLLLKSRMEELDLEGESVLEIGTGNGLLAVTAAEKGAEVTATDIDPEAIEDAEQRAREADALERIEFVRSDLFDEVSGTYDLVVFNPPYLPGTGGEGKTWKGGENGVETTARFLEQAQDYVSSRGVILFVASSLADIQKLKQDHELEEIDRKELWFETLYLFRSD